MTDKAAEVVAIQRWDLRMDHVDAWMAEFDNGGYVKHAEHIAAMAAKDAELAASMEREDQLEKELTNCANFCQGMSLDPSTPKHARDALAYRITKIVTALHHTGAKQ